MDGEEAVASYDAAAFASGFAKASGLDPESLEVKTSMNQDMQLDGVTELDDDSLTVLMKTTADQLGVPESSVTINGQGDRRRRASFRESNSLTLSLSIVVGDGDSVSALAAAAENASAAVAADLAKAGVDVTVVVEVTGLAITVEARVTTVDALDTVQGGDDFLEALGSSLDEAGITLPASALKAEVEEIVLPTKSPTVTPTREPTPIPTVTPTPIPTVTPTR